MVWYDCTTETKTSEICTRVWPSVSPSLAPLCRSYLKIQSNPTPSLSVNSLKSLVGAIHASSNGQYPRNADCERESRIIKKHFTQFRPSMSDKTLSCVHLPKCRRSKHCNARHYYEDFLEQRRLPHQIFSNCPIAC